MKMVIAPAERELVGQGKPKEAPTKDDSLLSPLYKHPSLFPDGVPSFE